MSNKELSLTNHRNVNRLTSSANLVGHIVQQLEVLAVLHAATSSNDAGSVVELRAIRLLHVLAHKLTARIGSGSGGVLRGGGSIAVSSGGEGSATDSDDLDTIGGLDSGDGVT